MSTAGGYSECSQRYFVVSSRLRGLRLQADAHALVALGKVRRAAARLPIRSTSAPGLYGPTPADICAGTGWAHPCPRLCSAGRLGRQSAGTLGARGGYSGYSQRVLWVFTEGSRWRDTAAEICVAARMHNARG